MRQGRGCDWREEEESRGRYLESKDSLSGISRVSPGRNELCLKESTHFPLFHEVYNLQADEICGCCSDAVPLPSKLLLSWPQVALVEGKCRSMMSPGAGTKRLDAAKREKKKSLRRSWPASMLYVLDGVLMFSLCMRWPRPDFAVLWWGSRTYRSRVTRPLLIFGASSFIFRAEPLKSYNYT